MAVTVIVSAFLLSPLGGQQTVVWTALGAMLLFANYAIARTTGGYFDAAAETNPLLHTWTLSLEEQFYLIFPALLLLGWLWAKRWRWAPHVLVALLGAVSLGVAMAEAAGVTIPLMPDGFVGFYGPVGRAWEFAVGALLALSAGRLRGRVAPFAAAVVGVALIVVAAVVFTGNTVFPGPATLLPVIGALLLLAADRNPVSRVLATMPMVWIGDRSYSWYLWHWPFIVFATVLWYDVWWVPAAAAILSLLPAMVSYRWVERPLRRGSISPRRLIPVVAVTLMVPLIAAGGVWAAAQRVSAAPELIAFNDALQLHATEKECMSYVPLNDETASVCMWNAAASGAPIYLTGDSMADAFSEGVIAAGETLGRPVTVTTAPGCPMWKVLDPPEAVWADAERCGPFVDGTLAWLEGQPAGTVLLGATDLAYWAPGELVPSRFTEEERRTMLGNAMTVTVERLQAAGHDVALLQAPPSYRYPESWTPRSCGTWEIINGDCGTTMTVGDMDRVQGPTREVFDQVAAASGAEVIDVRGEYCTDVCSSSRAGVPLYLDDIHISVAASRALAPLFVAALD